MSTILPLSLCPFYLVSLRSLVSRLTYIPFRCRRWHGRYLLFYVYLPAFQGGGQFFPLLFDRIMVGCIVAQLTIIGVLGVKGGKVQAPLLAPLLGCTIAFWHYCNKLYKPMASNMPQRIAVDVPLADDIPADEYLQVRQSRWSLHSHSDGLVVRPSILFPSPHAYVHNAHMHPVILTHTHIHSNSNLLLQTHPCTHACARAVLLSRATRTLYLLLTHTRTHAHTLILIHSPTLVDELAPVPRLQSHSSYHT